MKKIYKIITTLFLFCSLVFTAQNSRQEIHMKIDSIGDAHIKVTMTMNAQQWQNWSASFGNNPSALKREMERSMPSYFLDNFKLEKDDMNRSFELSLKAYGVCKINKRGKWSFDTDQKDANATELTSQKYMLVSSPPEFGGTLQQTYIVEFPEAAKDIKLDKDAFGNSIFEFKMDGPSKGNSRTLSIAGFVLLLVGGVWTGKNVLAGKQNSSSENNT
tara:strand:- start:10182 stop:10832 length:651 start_codon:yes stop_codon:yes gene_type:complete